MEEKITVPVAQGVAIGHEPGQPYTGVSFKTKSGEIHVGIPDAELSRMVALFLNQAQQNAASTTPDSPPEKLAATPIMASHLGFARGRSDTESLIAFQVGHLHLSFAVELSMLHAQCKTLLSNVVETEKKPSSN